MGFTPLVCFSAKAFYSDILDMPNYIPMRKSLLRKRAGLKERDARAAWPPHVAIEWGFVNKYMVFFFKRIIRANHAFEPNAEVPPFSFVSRFAKGPKITELEDTHLQPRHVFVSIRNRIPLV